MYLANRNSIKKSLSLFENYKKLIPKKSEEKYLKKLTKKYNLKFWRYKVRSYYETKKKFSKRSQRKSKLNHGCQRIHCIEDISASKSIRENKTF